jgi:hypothetical protein
MGPLEQRLPGLGQLTLSGKQSRRTCAEQVLMVTAEVRGVVHHHVPEAAADPVAVDGVPGPAADGVRHARGSRLGRAAAGQHEGATPETANG